MINNFNKLFKYLFIKSLLLINWLHARSLKDCFIALNNLASLESARLFPELTLKESSDIARHATTSLLFQNYQDSEEQGENANIVKVKTKLKENEEFVSLITNAHRILAYKYNSKSYSKLSKGWSEKHLNLAKSYDEFAYQISDSRELKSLLKTFKKARRASGKSMTAFLKDKIAEERAKQLDVISITRDSCLTVIGLFSSLFIPSGLIYSKIVYASIGLDVSHFFTLSDYVASSVNVIMAALLGTIFGVLGLLHAMYIELDRLVLEQQLGHTDRDTKKYGYVVFAILTAPSIVQLILFREIELLTLIPIFVLFFLFFLLKLINLIRPQNSKTIFTLGVALICYGASLAHSILIDIRDLKSGEYSTGYVVSFHNSYGRYADFEFVGSNSSFVFLYSYADNISIALPRSAVTEIKSERTAENSSDNSLIKFY